MLSHKFEHALTDTAFSATLLNQLKLLGSVPNNVPPSWHVLKDLIGAVGAEELERHVCPSCNHPLPIIPRSQWKQNRHANCSMCGVEGPQFRIRGADIVVPSQRYYNLFREGEPIRLKLGNREWARSLSAQRESEAQDSSTLSGSQFGRGLSSMLGGALQTRNDADREGGYHMMLSVGVLSLAHHNP
jgi:predicted RNA-binding Zn-ribbon protein involved in translation (DUF1610 family)